jgi:phosphohistidine phosphatase
MRLYLVQHGQAKSEAEDPDRPLTERGVEDVTRVARYAVDHLDVRPARVVHSGKTRARQTAEIWGVNTGAPVSEADALAPNDDPAVWAARVLTEATGVMLVGHLPHLARLSSLLLGGSERGVVQFQPGALLVLERAERADDGWLVAALMPPTFPANP